MTDEKIRDEVNHLSCSENIKTDKSRRERKGSYEQIEECMKYLPKRSNQTWRVIEDQMLETGLETGDLSSDDVL